MAKKVHIFSTANGGRFSQLLSGGFGGRLKTIKEGVLSLEQPARAQYTNMSFDKMEMRKPLDSVFNFLPVMAPFVR